MSGGPRVRSLNSPDSEQRPVLVPAGNKARTTIEARKPAAIKPQRKAVEKSPEDKKQAQLSPGISPPIRNFSAPSILRNHQQHVNQLIRVNLSLNASCSSDASSDSSQSRASTAKISRSSVPVRRKPVGIKLDKGDVKIERVDKVEKIVNDDGQGAELDGIALKKRCAWVTPNTEDSSYANFHDEEWGVPLHDDNKLFELLSLAVALAELTWPTIIKKRNLFREVFLDFDPISVSKLNEKNICARGSLGSTLLSEIKLRNIVENARQVCKIKDEFGSFNKYIWGFMSHKPLVNKFRYQRQVPVKTSKADAISKDLVRRGFRGVGPSVIYSFMQAAGLTNDHLVTCFRFQECVAAGEGVQKEDTKVKVEKEKQENFVQLELARGLDEVSICSD